MNLNELRDKAYKNACEHGFHDQELSNEHCLCLIISELMEAVEADRKGKQFNNCLLYTSPSPRDRTRSRMPSSA